MEKYKLLQVDRHLCIDCHHDKSLYEFARKELQLVPGGIPTPSDRPIFTRASPCSKSTLQATAAPPAYLHLPSPAEYFIASTTLVFIARHRGPPAFRCAACEDAAIQLSQRSQSLRPRKPWLMYDYVVLRFPSRARARALDLFSCCNLRHLVILLRSSSGC